MNELKVAWGILCYNVNWYSFGEIEFLVGPASRYLLTSLSKRRSDVRVSRVSYMGRHLESQYIMWDDDDAPL